MEESALLEKAGNFWEVKCGTTRCVVVASLPLEQSLGTLQSRVKVGRTEIPIA